MNSELIRQAAQIISQSGRIVAFTGAGISVESGIPPFRGPNGLWSKYDPKYLDIGYFHSHPLESWQIIKEIFYDFFGRARPNAAHYVLAEMEKEHLLQTVITQNIDYLHQEAGSKNVYEYHGNSRQLVCTQCHGELLASEANLDELPPLCPQCGGLLKPDFVFFGEAIPQKPLEQSYYEANHADIFIIVGSTGEIMPASLVPAMAKDKGCKIIEVNVEETNYTRSISDVFLQGKATEVFRLLADYLGLSILGKRKEI